MATYHGYQHYTMNNLHVVDIPSWDAARRFSESKPETRPTPTGFEGEFYSNGMDKHGLRGRHLNQGMERRAGSIQDLRYQERRGETITTHRKIDGAWYRWNTELQRLLDDQSAFAKDIERLVNRIEKVLPVPAFTRKRKKVRGKQGAIYNIHAANMGRHHKAWSRTVKIDSNRPGVPKSVHLISNPTGNNAAGENAKWMGAAAYVLMRHFEAKRVKVALSFCDGVRIAETSSCLVAIRAKAAGRRMSLNSIAKFFNFDICSKIVYAFDIEMHGKKTRWQDHNVFDCPEMQKYLQDQTPGAKVITVPKLSSLRAAVRWIQEQVEEFKL